ASVRPTYPTSMSHLRRITSQRALLTEKETRQLTPTILPLAYLVRDLSGWSEVNRTPRAALGVRGQRSEHRTYPLALIRLLRRADRACSRVLAGRSRAKASATSCRPVILYCNR